MELRYKCLKNYSATLAPCANRAYTIMKMVATGFIV